MNSHRSLSPTPRSSYAKPVDPNVTSGAGSIRRLITNNERQTLQNVMIDERDIELLREYMEKYSGNIKVRFFFSSMLLIIMLQKVEENTETVKSSIKQMYIQTSNSSQGTKAIEAHNRKLLRNEVIKLRSNGIVKIRELERKIMETDSKSDLLEDELKFQNQVMQKVVQQLPGASYFKRGDMKQRNIEEEEAFLT